jgi:16S rRNA (adenine1518-N6/adenine1519-N6)-dimethyltransferase
MNPRPRKRFGQHFLHDRHAIERIIAAVAARPGEAIVEIGPGRGALTEALYRSAGALDVIEIDRDLAALLRARYAAAPSFRLHERDALEFDFAQLARERGSRLRIVGNLPYNISTPLLFHLLGAPAAISDLTIMLQREVVDRIVAATGSGAYGRLSVMLSPWVDAQRLFDLGPGAFVPPPKVWSTVLRMLVLPTPRFAVDERYGRVVAAAFAQRRKTLRNSLRGYLSEAQIRAAAVDPGARAETLSPQAFAALAQLLPKS